MKKITRFILGGVVTISAAALFIFAYVMLRDGGIESVGNQADQEATVWYANNTQKIKNIYFGPSPRSEDTKKLFAPDRNALWDVLAGASGFNGIELHVLTLDNLGVSVQKPQNYINAVTLSDAEIIRVKELQDKYSLKVVVPAGIMLTHYCREPNITTLAKNAAAAEMKIYTRLYKAGVRIDEFAVDGAFLHLIDGSEKGSDEGEGASCFNQGRIFTNVEVAQTVATYLTELITQATLQRTAYLTSKKSKIKEQYAPSIVLIENVPNWQIDDFYEMHYGQTPMSLASTYNDIIVEFKKTNYPPIATVLIDYPYNFISGQGIFTKASTKVGYDNCKNGVTCTKISAADSFKGKIVGLYRLIHDLRGAPNLSFYVNTGDSYAEGKGNPLCATAEGSNWKSITAVPLIVYAHNRCFEGGWPFNQTNGKRNTVWSSSTVDTKPEADADQSERDVKYFTESRMYYNLITKGLPKGVIVDNLYVTSWHTNPRFGAVHGLKMQQVISELRK